jgi:hypothetical protein
MRRARWRVMLPPSLSCPRAAVRHLSAARRRTSCSSRSIRFAPTPWARTETPPSRPRGSTGWLPEGARFVQAHASTVVTLPVARQHPLDSIRSTTVCANAGFRFPAGVETLASLLARGYRTAALSARFPSTSLWLDAQVRHLRRPLPEGEGETPRSGAGAARRHTVATALTWIGHSNPASAPAGPWLAWVHLYEPHFRMCLRSRTSRYRARPISGCLPRRGARTAAPADSRRHGRPRHPRRADLGPRGRSASMAMTRAVCLRGDAAGAARHIPAAPLQA